MNNNEIFKNPMPVWGIILFAVLSGGLMCFITDISTGDYRIKHLIVAFGLGASGFIYLYLLIRIAKNPTPWLSRNFRLIATIGGAINALIILWAILSKH
jgi:hypothetical protein